MKHLAYLFITLITFVNVSPLHAAGDQYDNMGKISAVIICSSLVILGIAAYMFYIERRLKKLERGNEDRENLIK